MEEQASKAATKMEGPGQVTAVDPKKHEQGLRVAEWNWQNRKKLKVQKSESKLSQCYGNGAVMVVSGTRCSQLLHLPIQRCHSGSLIRHDFILQF